MIKQLPSYERIFGEIDFKKGDEARSVYSPAAYLADLLQLLDDEFKEHGFDQRRSDIKEILLDAKNTFEMLPYLDRVNQILGSKITNHSTSKEEAFEQIRKAVYPFNLPQDIDYATVKVYLEHLGVKAEELYRLLDDMPQQELLAKAYLGILEQEWVTLIETPRSGEKLAKCYGFDDLPDLKVKVKDKDDKDKDVIVVIVDKFIQATDISELELRELLFQNLNNSSEKLQDANFFCNDDQKGAADLTKNEQGIKWQSKGSTSQAQGLEFWLDRANRFIRLAKKIGFTFTELDIILRTCCKNELNAKAITRIAVVHWLKKKLELEVDEICAFFNQINILGQGNEEMPIDLFNRVYNNRCAIADKQYISNHKNIPQQFKSDNLNLSKIEFNSDILHTSNDSYRKRVAHSWDLPTKQLTYLIKKFRSHFDNDKLWSTANEERSMLTTFYRVSKLAHICEISLEELFIIFEILEKDPAVRQFKNCHVLIDFKIDERDCYKIISNENKDNNDKVEDSMWLIQVVYGLTQWMQKNDFSAHELLKITSGAYVDKIDLKKIDDTMPVKKVKTQKEIDDQEKLALFNGWHQSFKALHFKESLLKEAGLDSRTARLVHQALSDRKYHLTKKEPRLLSFDAHLVKNAAIDAVKQIDTITEKDFLGLGIGEKIANKIYDNLLHKGHLNSQGRLIEDKLTTDVDKFHIDTDFIQIRSELFNQISKLHQDHDDVSIYPSDLKPLGLQEFESRELYHNLIFNGYIDDQGALVEKSFFEDADNEEDFEVNANIGSQSKDVFEILSKRSQKIKLHKIAINKGIFSKLALTELEVDDLLENLKFNEYIDEDGHFVDNLKLTQLKLKDFSLALQFYPQRTAILSALKQHLAKNLSSYLTFSREDFLKVAEKIVARWSFLAVEHHFLEGGKIAEKHKAFFREEENSNKFDIWWSFEPTDNQMVFNTLRNIVLMSDKLQLVDDPLDRLSFTSSEKEELFDLLLDLEYITADRKIAEEKLDYFLNINNALTISLEGFEDYNKDIFFFLHAIAKEESAIVNKVVSLVKTLAERQETFIYQQLKQKFNLSIDSMRIISAEMFKGSDHIGSEWLLPLLKAEDILGNITKLPKEQSFNNAYRRTQQFAVLANKLKLTKEDIELVFNDQSLVEKFPEKLTLPQKPTPIKTFDALLESTDGKIYLFNGERYWIYDGVTYELEEEEGKELKDLSVHFVDQTIDAAFVDNDEQNVIIAGGKYYQQAKDSKVWELKEREWGKLDNNFQNLDKIDAAYTDSSGYTYLFSGEEYVRKYKKSDYIDEGYPKNIAQHWKNEPGNQQLPKIFQESIDAAFVGHDGNTYLFKNDQFVSSDDLTKAESILAKWGRGKNNLKTTAKVDAAYIDDSQMMIFCGDQIFSFDDCLENDRVMPSEGFPQLIKEYFTNLPAEFYQDIDAAFKDNNGVIYLFKDKKYITGGDEGKKWSSSDDIKGYWGKTSNPLTNGKVDAAFVGLDGKTYLFSGNQYFRYSSDDYSEVDAGYPRTIKSDWGGLEQVNAAFVLDGKTYLFDNPTSNSYIRYSTNEYKEADKDYPRDVDNNWWTLSQKLIDPDNNPNTKFAGVDAVFTDYNGNIYLFSGDQFIYFDDMHRWWSEPQNIKDKWDDITFDTIDAAFTGKDGKTYFFYDKEYVRFSDKDFCNLDNGYPRTTEKFWGNIKNNIEETGKIDAAVRLYSEWEEKDKNTTKGKTKIIKKSAIHTYLFSGSQFFRYTHGKDDNNPKYDHVDSGYPKSIKDSLADEPRFKNLKEDKESLAFIEKLSAAFADQRNIYVFTDRQLRVISNSKSKIYEKFPDPNSKINCAFIEDGSVYIKRKNVDWQHSTSLEGVIWGGPQKDPELLTKLPDHFKSGIDAVLKGTDGNTYLFKGNKVYNLLLDETTDIQKEWGRVANRIYESGKLDAGFVGRDGNTYLFSGDQFFTYKDAQLLTYDPKKKPVAKTASELPEMIKDKWGGLTRVAHAYVLDGKTYLLEPTNEDGEFRYVCYSSNDYTKPDTEKPIETDQSFWKIPQEYQEDGFDRVDALYVDGDNLILIHDGKFLEYNPEKDYWSHPKSLDQLWDGIDCDNHVIEELTTVFVDKAGAIHCFNPECFLTITPDSTNPGSLTIGDIHRTRYHWGLVENILTEKVDAAVVDSKGITYLFSGDKYVRYSSDDYRQIDQDYPKSIAINLRKEASFKHLPDEFEAKIAEGEAITAALINQRNVYLVIDSTLFVASTELAANYNLNKLACGEQTFLANGKIDAAIAYKDSSDNKLTYLFSGNRFIRYSGDEYEYIDSGYPKTIASGLLGEKILGESIFTNVPIELVDGIDAALIDKDGKIHLIKDQHLWVIDSNAQLKEITTWLKTDNKFDKTESDKTKSIDAAIIDPEGGLIVFKGDQYIRYANPLQKYVDQGYPKSIANNWGNLPKEFEDGINGAFQFEGHSYFVKGEQYVRFINNSHECPKIMGPYEFEKRWGNWADYLISDLKAIAKFKKLNDTYANGDSTLTDILHPKQGYTKLPYFDLAELFDWDINQLKWLKKNNGFLQNHNQFESRFNIELILRIFDFFEVAHRISTEPKQLYEKVLTKLDGGRAELKSTDESHYNGEKFSDDFWINKYEYQDLKLKAGDSVYFESQDKNKLIGPYIIERTDDNKLLQDHKSKEPVVLIQLDPKKRLPGGQVDISFSLVSMVSIDIVAAKEELTKLLKSTHCGAEGVELLYDEIRDELNLLKRDALLPYAIHQDTEVNNARELYQKLLIDVEMGSEVSISKIKEAIAAVQLYMHRYFINLEDAKLRDTNQIQRRQELLKRWEWMKNYRVWEANRKVFLYPENYIRAELRDNKTPEFKALEQELLQGELNDINVTQAFNGFIDKYIELSQLKVAGGYVYDNPENPDDKNMVLFGHTISEPRRYYYRNATFINGETNSVNWQPWEEVNIQINSERVYPVYTLNRVYVFWAEIEQNSDIGPDTEINISSDENNKNTKVDSNATFESVLQIYYSYYDLNKTWVPAQKLNYSITSRLTITEYFLDFSSSKKNSDLDLDSILINCRYTTDQGMLKAKIKDNKYVDVDDLIKLIEEATTEKKVYFTAIINNNKYIVNSGLSDSPTHDPVLDNLSVKRFIAGEKLKEPEHQFQIEKNTDDETIAIKATAKNIENYYFRSYGIKDDGDGDGDWHYQIRLGDYKLDNLGLTHPVYKFKLKEGRIGEGYTMYNFDGGHTWVMSFNDKRQLRLDPFDPNAKDEVKRRQTFQIIAEKRQWISKLRFYPETRKVKNETSDQDRVDVNSSGKNLFEDLFPDENSDNLELPIILNSALEDQSLNWTCFHYKGASFLAKPHYKIDTEIVTGQISPNSDTFIMSAAFVDKNNRLYAFSTQKTYGTYNNVNQLVSNTPQDDNNDNQSLLETIEIQNIKNTKEKWGKVNNLIQEDNAIDAACVIDGKIYLFRGEQYICYSNGITEFADEGYPDQHKTMTGWDEEIDAAFHFEDKSYFIKGNEYTVSDDPTKKKPLSDLWNGVSSIDYALTKNKYLYLISGTQYCRYSGTSLKNPDSGYPKPIAQGLEDGIPDQEGITAAFTPADNTIYFFKDNNYFIFKVVNGLVAHYPFNGNADDKSSNGHNGEVHGATLTSDRFDNANSAYKFEGENYIQLPNTESLKLHDHSFTVSAWVYIESFPQGAEDLAILGTESDQIGETDKDLHLVIRDKKLYMGFYNNDTQGKTELAEHQWYFLTWKYDKKNQEQSIFINEKNDGSKTGADPFTGKGSVKIGRWKVSHESTSQHQHGNFNGTIDEVIIYDRALTDDEIKQLAGKLTTPSEIKLKFGQIRNPIQTDDVVDAAFTHGEKTYLFSDDLYYRYDRSEFDDNSEFYVEPGYPKLLTNNTDDLPTWKNGVRAVFKKDDKVHFFSKSLIQYAVFDPESTPSLESENIKGNLVLRHGFNALDAAFSHESDVYIVYGNKYVKVNAEQIVTAKKTKYDIIRLSSMTGSKLSQKLFAHGIDGLFSLRNQEIDELPIFTPEDVRGDSIIRVNSTRIETLPLHSHLEFRGANGLHYWELFFHAPLLIAQSLNTQQKFAEAKKWFEYIFDPTDEFEYWQFLPFLSVDIDALINQIKYYTSQEYELKLISTDTKESLPEKGENLVILAKIREEYRVKIFDQEGKTIRDYKFKPDEMLIKQWKEASNRQGIGMQPKWEITIENQSKWEILQNIATYKDKDDPELIKNASNVIGLLQPYDEVFEGKRELSSGYDLRVMKVDNTDDLVDKGKSLVIVALVDKALHIRIFDVGGEQVVDKKESELEKEAVTKLRQRLDQKPDESNLSLVDKQKIIKYATSSAGHPRPLADKKDMENLPITDEFTTLETNVDQLDQDNPNAKALAETLEIVKRLPDRYGFMVPDETSSQPQIQAYLNDPSDANAIARLRRIAYRRTTVMAYIDNLIDWGDKLFRQYSRESINEARMLYLLAYDLLGQKPENTGTVILSDPLPFGHNGNNPLEGIHDRGAENEKDSRKYDFLFDVKRDSEEKSLTFAANIHSSVTQPYFYIPENQNLIDYWDRIEDRMYKIRHSLNIMGIKQPLPLFQPPIDPMALVRAVAGGAGIGGAVAGLSVPVPHYRFDFMLNKARELVGKLNQFGGDLLSAIEKKDSEALSLLQNRHEKEILEVTSRIKEAQLNEALENLKSLEENLQSAKWQHDHYTQLLADGYIQHEENQLQSFNEAFEPILFG